MIFGCGITRGAAVMLAVGLCACAMPGMQQRGTTEEGVFTSVGVASVHSFECAHNAVTSRGYAVRWYDGAQETLRAERQYGDGAERYRGYLTVYLTQDNVGRYLRVSAERWADGSRVPVPANPSPQPTPPTPRIPQVVARRSSRRVSPGPVAGDARSVVDRCAVAGEGSFSTAR